MGLRRWLWGKGGGYGVEGLAMGLRGAGSVRSS